MTTEEGFEALLAMDGDRKVEQGTRYPAVLHTTGMNDQRVGTWMSARLAAKLQAATTSYSATTRSIRRSGVWTSYDVLSFVGQNSDNQSGASGAGGGAALPSRAGCV